MLVYTDEQTHGRGQRGSFWHSEPSKNLIFSVFVKLNQFNVERQFELNQAVSLSLISILKKYLSDIQIKWPNDIMSDNYKIGGILIENTVRNVTIKHSIIGIGLNINQTNFPSHIPNASSLKKLLGKDFNLEKLLQDIHSSLKDYILLLENNPKNFFQQEYLENLYLWRKISWFQDNSQQKFKGKIVGISTEGKLQIELKYKELKEFGFKEVEFLTSLNH